MTLVAKLWALPILFASFTASAQTCNNPTIVSAYQLALSRAPTAVECDARRYAGGNFQNTTQLIPLVKASQVCQDPWIAQAYYTLGRPINGHDPTQLESGRPGSTMDQCNYSKYGSWPDFPTLVKNVTNYLSPPAAPKPVAQGPTAQVTSVTLIKNQPGVVRWTYSGTSTCAQGVYVMLNGGNYSPAVPLNAGGANIDARYTNFAYTVNTQVAISVADACTGKAISPNFTATAVVQTPAAPVAAAPVTSPAPIKPAGALGTGGLAPPPAPTAQVLGTGGLAPSPPTAPLTNPGQLVAPNAAGVVAQGAGNKPGAGVVGTGGSSVVAQGAGNVVAQGAGNVVAQGAGNVVAQGAGNLVSNAGGTARSIQSVAAPATGSFTISQFAGAWATDKRTMRVTWNYSGTPSASQTVIVQVQAAGKTIDICTSGIALKSCQNAPSFVGIPATTLSGTLVLLDGISRKQLSNAGVSLRP